MMLSFNKFNKEFEINDYFSLFNDAFPEVGGGSEEGYNWLFHSYPDSDNKSFEYGAYIDNQLVGYYAAIPYQYKIGNKQTPVGMVCGVMTHSQQRGKGIFTHLGAFSTNDLSKYVPFTIGYPIRKAVIPGHLKIGWEIAFELPLYVHILQSTSLLKSKNLSLFSYVINPFLFLYTWITKTRINNNYILEKTHSIESIEGLFSFTAEWGNNLTNSLVKDSKFMSWRYSRPNAKYIFFVVRKKNIIVSFAACRRVKKMGIPSLCILDFMNNGDKKSIDIIYSAIVAYSKANKLEAIMTMMSKTSSRNYRLIKNGFIRSPFIFKLIIKNLTDEFSDELLLNEKNWHLMWVDSDDL